MKDRRALGHGDGGFGTNSAARASLPGSRLKRSILALFVLPARWTAAGLFSIGGSWTRERRFGAERARGAAPRPRAAADRADPHDRQIYKHRIVRHCCVSKWDYQCAGRSAARRRSATRRRALVPESLDAAPAGEFVVVSGSPPKIHLPSCELRDPDCKIRYRNAVTAKRQDPAASVCETCQPDLEARRKALNDSGIFLHSAVLKRMKKSDWDVRSEVPVSAAPFLYDPVKEPGVLKKTGAGHRLNRQKFRKAVADSQNRSLIRETAVDVVATSGTLVLCIEVKKLNRRYVSWVFANHDTAYNGMAVLTKTPSGKNPLELWCVPKVLSKRRDISIRMESSGVESDLPTYDQGLALTVDSKGMYGFGNNSLAEATRQIVEGTFGLAVESLMQDVSSGRFKEQSFMPVIVTTADIFTCKYGANDLTADGVSGLSLEQQELIIYNCPIPMRARFPNQIADLKHHKQTRLSTKWPVLILSPKGLDALLKMLENFERTA